MDLSRTYNMRATKDGFGRGIAEIATLNEKIVVLGADITASVGLGVFRDRFPNRFFSFGIAEQNVASVAAGLALEGLLPVFSTYATFVTTRCLDQVRVSIAYNNLKVIIGGAHAGILVGPDGATHQALEDIAIMRAIPRMTVISPCDAMQVEKAVKKAVEECKGPIYIRFGREPVPEFTNSDQEFEIGKTQLLKDGEDVTIIATGHMVWESLLATKILEQSGISCQVVNCHTIKPIDQSGILSFAKKTGKIVTVEEHQVLGGLGSAVSEVLSTQFPCPMLILGINDTFGESGSPRELFKKYQIDSESIARKVEIFLKQEL